MKQNKEPKLIVVGAGPGDPELLTIKALKAIQSADAILYDALVNKDIIGFAPDAKHHFVGKRKGNHTYTQEEINQLIVEFALNYGTVVRLKGGDPFIFGRGSEEIEYAEKHGLKIEIIPGISSSTSLPALQGISLTKRGVSESFWVITGTTSERKLSNDIHLAAKSSATIVVLMGMSKLAEIQKTFRLNEKGDIPVAIIQNGSTDREKIGVGTIDTIDKVVEEKQLKPPAIIVIGEVVKYSHLLKPFFENIVNTYN